MTAGAELVRLAPTLAELELVRDLIAPGATDDELALFAKICAHVELSPFADQIALIPRYSSAAGRNVYKSQILVAGRRALAERTGELRGIDGPEWAGPRVDGELRWLEVWDRDDGPPYCARAFVYRAGWVKPANGTVKFSEFAPRYESGNRRGELMGLWPRMPSHMLGKVAESLALRRAFPDVIQVGALESFADPETERDLERERDLAETEAELPKAAARAREIMEAAREAGPVRRPLSETAPEIVAEAELEPDEREARARARADESERELVDLELEQSAADELAAIQLGQAGAHAVIGTLPKARQIEFLQRHRIPTFGIEWPMAALVEAAEIAREPLE